VCERKASKQTTLPSKSKAPKFFFFSLSHSNANEEARKKKKMQRLFFPFVFSKSLHELFDIPEGI
jgi:hypothetical protein